jgi:hypothetical protein
MRLSMLALDGIDIKQCRRHVKGIQLIPHNNGLHLRMGIRRGFFEG